MYLSFAGIIIVYRIFLKKSTSGAAHFPESCQYFCRCRSASFFRRTRAAQSGQYLARLDFGVNTAPHSTQRFTSSRLLLISAHRAASSSELAMAKSVRKNAQPQIENLCSKGAWGTSLNKRVGLSG